MEGGGPFFPSGHNQPEGSSSAGFDILPSEMPAANPDINEEQPAQPQHAAMREPGHCIPISNVTRIMRQILPPHARISEDAKETLQVCVSEFISFLTGEANDRCHRDRRITVTPDDVLWAVRNLGFHDYVEPLTAYLSRHRGQHVLARRHAPALPPLPPPSIHGAGNFPAEPILMGMGGYYADICSGAGSSSNAPENDDPSGHPETRSFELKDRGEQ